MFVIKRDDDWYVSYFVNDEDPIFKIAGKGVVFSKLDLAMRFETLSEARLYLRVAKADYPRRKFDIVKE